MNYQLHSFLKGRILYGIFWQLNYSWSKIGRTNSIVHQVITLYKPISFDDILMLYPRL